jgi:hypothetical protein
MFARMVVIGIVAAAALMGGSAIGPAVVGTISSSAPITINGSEMSPSAAPSWPLVAKDEITNSAPALLQTAGHDLITLDANSKARISKAGNGFEYIYVRQGGLQFDTRTGPMYVCIAGHLYVPAKSARGSLRLDSSGAVDSRLERGVFAEQGARVCGPDVAVDFLDGLPKAAGGSIGPAPGGLSTGAKVGIGLGIASGAAAGSASLFSSSPCASPNGCNFNPASISPSQP